MCKFSRRLALLFGLCLLGIHHARAFTLLSATKTCRVASLAIGASSRDDDQRTDNDDESSIPQLPAIGESSFGEAKKAVQQQQESLADGKKKAVAFVSDKFELQYTCKICDTRNAYRVSRLGE
jgi:hypothetical protein